MSPDAPTGPGSPVAPYRRGRMGDDRDHLSELRTDPLTGVQVQVTGSRQKRPNLPTTGPAGCPFCVGGTESPEPYRVRAFRNRWPSFPDDRCEVVL